MQRGRHSRSTSFSYERQPMPWLWSVTAGSSSSAMLTAWGLKPDMRTGVAFGEDYTATSGLMVEYRKSTNWNPLGPGESPSDLRSFYQLLRDSDGHHGGRFHYISPNTDLLGWVVERASGRRFADIMSNYLWKPMGAEYSAYVTVDRLGAPRCAGGTCTTARDLARVGQLLVNDGIRAGKNIIPATWINDIIVNGSEEAWAAGIFAPFFPGRGCITGTSGTSTLATRR